MSKSNSRFVDFRCVKESVSITQILEHYGLMAELRRVNDDSLTGTCPIHKGENKTAFRVSISKNCWNCFSQCKCGGNILDFVSRMENVSLHKAATLIAEWFDVQDAFEVPIKPERTEKSSSTRSKKESVATGAAKKPVGPSLSDEDKTITENKPLGFSLQHLESAHPYLIERGLSEETIVTFGLGFCSKGTMVNRVAIPIHNANGQLVAYAGRWPGENPPNSDEKYKLPKGFRKTLEVFNLHRIAQTDPAKPLIVVEGFFGCMKLWQAGQKRVVSVMGSSVSEYQELAILKAAEQSRKIVLMFDEDESGREGREQALKRFASKAYVKVIELGKEGLQPDQLTVEEISDLKLEESKGTYQTAPAKFPIGILVATPEALAKLTQSDIAAAVGRHTHGDWGDLDEHDKEANSRALMNRERLLSVYHSLDGIKFYVITEADRSLTTVLLPEDY